MCRHWNGDHGGSVQWGCERRESFLNIRVVDKMRYLAHLNKTRSSPCIRLATLTIRGGGTPEYHTRSYELGGRMESALRSLPCTIACVALTSPDTMISTSVGSRVSGVRTACTSLLAVAVDGMESSRGDSKMLTSCEIRPGRKAGQERFNCGKTPNQ
jgi:hypothetical protein